MPDPHELARAQTIDRIATQLAAIVPKLTGAEFLRLLDTMVRARLDVADPAAPLPVTGLTLPPRPGPPH